MRLGGFGRIADYDNIRQAGFDYAELDVPEIEALTENEFRIFCDKVHEIWFSGADRSKGASGCQAMVFYGFF